MLLIILSCTIGSKYLFSQIWTVWNLTDSLKKQIKMACFLNDYGCNTSVYHDKITEERHLKCTVKSPTIHADLLLMKVIWHHQKYKKPRLYGVLLEFVREWVMKCPKMLLTFADTPHRSWSYVGFYNFFFQIFDLSHKSNDK